MQDFGEMVCLPMKNKPYLIAIFMLICLAGCVTPTLMPTPEAMASATLSPVPPTLTPTPDEKLKLVKEIQFTDIVYFAWAPDSTAVAMIGQMEDRRDVIALYPLNAEGPKWIVDADFATVLSFTSDGKYVVYLPTNGVLTFLDVETGEIAYTMKQCTLYSSRIGMAILTDKNKVYTLTNFLNEAEPLPADVYVWDTEAAACKHILSTGGIVRSASLNNNGYLLVNLEGAPGIDGSSGMGIRVLDTQSNTVTCSITSLSCERGVLNPTRNEMMVECNDGLERWDVETCTLKQKYPEVIKIGRSTIDPEGHIWAALYNRKELLFWSLDTETILYQMPVTDSIRLIMFDPSGAYLLTLSSVDPRSLSSTTLRIWQVEFQGTGAN